MNLIKKILLSNFILKRTINQMTVTLSCDHRVVDGAVGA